jgi:NAD-dependent dihydropyrimidine dehydrogenase PreA subunit
MIHVDQMLCAGCGTCVEECPTGAITLNEGTALIDTTLCNECGECIKVCPNQALAWVAHPVPETATEPSALIVHQPPVEVINVPQRRMLPWRGAVLPAITGALAWVGREVVPRLTPVALDALDGVLDRRLSRWSKDTDVSSTPKGAGMARGRQRRRRNRQGRS